MSQLVPPTLVVGEVGARGDRADLVALNASLKAKPPPMLQFGAIPSAPVGTSLPKRTDLCLIGLHRHFLSEAAYTPQGVESLLVDEQRPGDSCDDLGERLVYRGCGEAAAQRAACLRALRQNVKDRRTVRVLRVVHDESTAARSYRYDGLYAVVDGDDADSFVLQRGPGQPPLPLGTGSKGRRKRARAAEAGSTQTFRRYGTLATRGPIASLPAAAEALCAGEALTVGEALDRLRRARDEALAALTSADTYALARRSALNQLRVRAAVEILHAGAPTAAGWTAAGGALERWPARASVR